MSLADILGRAIVKADNDGQLEAWGGQGRAVQALRDRWVLRGLAAAGALGLSIAVSPLVSIAPMAAYAIGFIVLCGLTLHVAAATDDAGARRLPVALVGLALLLLQARLQYRSVLVAPLVLVSLLWVTTAVGHALGRRIEHPGHMVFVAWISAVSDIFSVFHRAGATHAMAESEAALSVVALPFPMLGTPDVLPFLGGGDVVFVALYVAVTRRHGLSVARTSIGLALGFFLTLLSLLVLERVVPALPFIGIGVLLTQPAMRRPPQAQRAAAVGLATALSAAVFIILALDRN